MTGSRGPTDLLHPDPEVEAMKNKHKRLIQSPNSFFMDVRCPGCHIITTVFSHAQSVVFCASCNMTLCQPTGGRCKLTEGCSFRKKAVCNDFVAPTLQTSRCNAVNEVLLVINGTRRGTAQNKRVVTFTIEIVSCKNGCLSLTTYCALAQRLDLIVIAGTLMQRGFLFVLGPLCFFLEAFASAEWSAAAALRIPLRYVPELGYLIRLQAGTPVQTLTLVLDSDNEGIRLFVPSKTLERSTFDPSLSTSSLYCIYGSQCRTAHTSRPYDCSSFSRNENDAEYFEYSLSRSIALETLTGKLTYFCERRAEGIEDVLVPVTAVYRNTSTTDPNGGGVRVLSAPVKYVEDISDCNRTAVAHVNAVSFHGILGIRGLSCRQPVFMDLLQTRSGSNLFTLDLSQTSPSLSLIQTTTNDQYSARASFPTIWSEIPQPNVPELAGLAFLGLYAPTMCQADLGMNMSSHWGAVLDLNTPCLGLPAPLWDSVMTWLPVTCPGNKNATRDVLTNAPYRCHVSQPESKKTGVSDFSSSIVLPFLSFTLKQTIDDLPPDMNPKKNFSMTAAVDSSSLSPSNSQLVIPLERLLLPNGELCIDRLLPAGRSAVGSRIAMSIADGTRSVDVGPSSLKPPIRLGTMLLQHYLVHFSNSNNSIGFSPKEPFPATSPTSGCQKRAHCKGQQTYFAPLNTCLDRDCSRWFFKRLNPRTRKCEYPSSIVVSAFLLVLCCIVTELYGDFLYTRAIKYARERCR